MRYLILWIFGSVIFASCDPELNYYYSIENTTDEDILVSSLPTFADDTIATLTIISANSTVEFDSHHFIGTTENIDSDPIYLEVLEITNADSIPYNQDPLDDSLWEKEKDGRHDGFFLLKVFEEDFF